MTHNIIKVHIEKSSSPIGNGVKEIEIMTFSQKREGGAGGEGGQVLELANSLINNNILQHWDSY